MEESEPGSCAADIRASKMLLGGTEERLGAQKLSSVGEVSNSTSPAPKLPDFSESLLHLFSFLF